jgi:hypothetical protein
MPAHFTEEIVEQSINANKAMLEAEASKSIDEFDLTGLIDAPALVILAVKTLFKHYAIFKPRTGIVVAGYGDSEIFPAYSEYQCYGLMLDKLIHEHLQTRKIDVTQTSSIRAFATKSMVDTFLMGTSPDVYATVAQELGKSLTDLADRIKESLGVDDIPDLDKHREEIFAKYRKTWMDSSIETHFRPLSRVVASLPVDEMAELAETLIMLQSLKEKVTAPTESVGGPIDVAIITKHEGLIWIKRKHYFDPNKNPRYLMRQQRIYKP